MKNSESDFNVPSFQFCSVSPRRGLHLPWHRAGFSHGNGPDSLLVSGLFGKFRVNGTHR